MPKKIVSGDFFKDVKRILGWGWKKGKTRYQNRVKKKRSPLKWLKREMMR